MDGNLEGLIMDTVDERAEASMDRKRAFPIDRSIISFTDRAPAPLSTQSNLTPRPRFSLKLLIEVLKNAR